MILESPRVNKSEVERRTGWAIKPEGACKGALCVPLPGEAEEAEFVDASVLAARLGMALIHDKRHELWCLGPESGGRALTSAVAPTLILPDYQGRDFDLASLRGRKVLLVAWASW